MPIEAMRINLEHVITVPDNCVLLEKEEYVQLIKKADSNQIWVRLSWLIEVTSMSRAWLLDNVLYPYREELEKNECVYFPKNQGEKWIFHRDHMSEFLDKRFAEILKNEK